MRVGCWQSGRSSPESLGRHFLPSFCAEHRTIYSTNIDSLNAYTNVRKTFLENIYTPVPCELKSIGGVFLVGERENVLVVKGKWGDV